MTKPLIEIALKLTGAEFPPEDITSLVQLTPTKTWRLGDTIQKTQLRRKHHGWVFGLPQRESHEMEGLLIELLDATESYKDRIAEAAEKFKLTKEISFGVYIHDETPASWFSANSMRRVSDLGASFDMDLILW